MKDDNDIALWSWHRGLNGIGIGANRGDGGWFFLITELGEFIITESDENIIT